MASSPKKPREIERYALYDEIASGGMGVVHVGRLAGSQGFARIVAIKRLHPQFAKDAEFVEIFVDEARLAARVRHPNVVTTLDVVEGQGEILVVMEYVHGETLARINRVLREQGELAPIDITSAILHGVLSGLHAAHEARTEHGASLGIVHRDVSPQNIMVGADGTPRVLDFGVAKAQWRAVTTREGQIKGKLSYMAPEQMAGLEIDRRADIYAAGIVLWEALTGRRLFFGDNPGRITASVLAGVREPPSARNPKVPPELDSVVMRALAREAGERFQTAMEMAIAIERAAPIATSRRISEWMSDVVAESLTTRADYVAKIERQSMLTADSVTVDRDEGGDGIGATRVLPTAAVQEPGSLSRASVTTGAASQPSAGKGMGRVFLLGTAAALMLLALGAGISLLRREPSASAVAPPEPASPRAAVSAVAPRVATSAPAPAPPPTATSTATEADAAIVLPAPSATVSARPVRRSPPAAPRPAARPAAKCDPPYTVDAKGIRVPKRECF